MLGNHTTTQSTAFGCSPRCTMLECSKLCPWPRALLASWDTATKWPFSSTARGEAQSFLQGDHSPTQQSRTTTPGTCSTRGSEKVLSCAKGQDCTAVSHMGEGTSTPSARPDSLESGVSWQQWQNNTSISCFYKYPPKSFNSMIKLHIIWDTKPKLLKWNLNLSLKEKTLRFFLFILLKLNNNRTIRYFKETVISPY